MASIARYCCCGGCPGALPGEPGANLDCDDITPETYTATFSGVSLCTGCDNDDNTGFKTGNIAYQNGFDINGSHTLTRGAGGGDWGLVIPNAITATSYTDAGCTTVQSGPETGSITIRLLRLETEWSLQVFAEIIAEWADAGTIFGNDGVTANTSGMLQLCETVPLFANELGPGTCGDNTKWNGPYIGFNGSATITCP